MEWDGGTIWRLCLGVLFVLCGSGFAYLMFRLGSAVREMSSILGKVDSRTLPLLSQVETTLNEVNSELSKVEQITGSVAEIVRAAEDTTTAVHKVVSTPLRKIAGVASAVRGTVKVYSSSRRKG